MRPTAASHALTAPRRIIGISCTSTLAKRKCGLGLIMTKLRQTIAHSVAMSILVLNLRKIQCALLRLLAFLVLWLVQQKKQPLFS